MTSEKFDPRDNDPLADWLDAARAEAPQLSPDLRARIIADATPVAAVAPRRQNSLGRWFAGWALPGLAGGLTAAAAGLWVGLFLPMPVMALDVPLWMQDALSYVDMIALPLIGLDDPLLIGM